MPSIPRRLLPCFTALFLTLTGCRPSLWLGRRLVQAPNTFPRIAAPAPRVFFDYPDIAARALPREQVAVGAPPVDLAYRVVPPRDYRVRWETAVWNEDGVDRPLYRFRVRHPAATNRFSNAPRGTLFLLHGYGLSHESLLPWAFRLAEEGWFCVVPDLRGHGESGGKRIGFGSRESTDLRELADHLDRTGRLPAPVAAFGVSYGAAVALHWLHEDPRLATAVAVSPYPHLDTAIENIRREYAPWIPSWLIRAGSRRIPEILGVPRGSLDPAARMTGLDRPVLLVGAMQDGIATAAEIDRLHHDAPPGSHLWISGEGTHEQLPFLFTRLAPTVIRWLDATPPGSGDPDPTRVPPPSDQPAATSP